jgi:hypothetical protein
MLASEGGARMDFERIARALRFVEEHLGEAAG